MTEDGFFQHLELVGQRNPRLQVQEEVPLQVLKFLVVKTGESPVLTESPTISGDSYLPSTRRGSETDLTKLAEELLNKDNHIPDLSKSDIKIKDAVYSPQLKMLGIILTDGRIALVVMVIRFTLDFSHAKFREIILYSPFKDTGCPVRVVLLRLPLIVIIIS